MTIHYIVFSIAWLALTCWTALRMRSAYQKPVREGELRESIPVYLTLSVALFLVVSGLATFRSMEWWAGLIILLSVGIHIFDSFGIVYFCKHPQKTWLTFWQAWAGRTAQ